VYTELLNTEKAYVADMQVLVKVFQQPLAEYVALWKRAPPR